jgi:nitrogen-specific signal transduction histidine kinase/uncharacterized membrane protein
LPEYSLAEGDTLANTGKTRRKSPEFWWLMMLCVVTLAIISIGYDHIVGWQSGLKTLHLLHLASTIGLSIIVLLIVLHFTKQQQLFVLPFESEREEENPIVIDGSQQLAGFHDSAQWLIKLRWMAIAGVGVVLLVTGTIFHMLALDSMPWLWLGLAVMISSNLIFYLWEKRTRRQDLMIFLQSIFDLLILTYLVYFSGGTHNPFILFYTFHVVIAGFLLSARRAYFIASLASILLVGMNSLQVLGWLSFHSIKFVLASPEGETIDPHRWEHLFPGSGYVHAGKSIAFVGTMFLLSLFTTTVARRLRREQAKSGNLARSLQRKVAELYAAEEAVTIEKEKLGAIIQCMNDGVLFINDKGEVALWNDVGHWLLEASEDIIKSVMEYHEENSSEQSQAQGESSKGKKPWSFHRNIKAGDHTFEGTFAPVYNDKGDYLGIVVVSRDITDRLRTEAQMAHHEQMTALGRMAAGITHEVGNPLSSLLAQIYLLEEEGSDKVVLEESIRVLKNEIERISRIVRGMSVFARPQKSEWEPCSINKIIGETVEFLHLEKKSHRLRITLDLDAELPAILASPGQLKQVFLNICLNAIDATEEGGNLTIRTKLTDEEVCASFRDTGHGIPPDLLGKIFNPFFSTKDQGKGTGLGLSITDSIIRAHGGRIEVESEVDKGTEFKVILPLRIPLQEKINIIKGEEKSEDEGQSSHH